jgi:hypothetical protein
MDGGGAASLGATGSGGGACAIGLSTARGWTNGGGTAAGSARAAGAGNARTCTGEGGGSLGGVRTGATTAVDGPAFGGLAARTGVGRGADGVDRHQSLR